jgi:hypothetical protein
MQDEIIKHAKKAYKNMKDPSKSLGHRVLEVIIEICIIVFAVSLSIWLHQKSEHAKEQAEVKEFLLGLKSDLDQTIENCKDNISSYEECKMRFSYLSSLNRSGKPNKDTLDKYFSEIGSSPVLSINSSRYEGFKSSGKLEGIENKKLLSDILNFFQGDVPDLQGLVRGWNSLHLELNEMVIDKLVEHDDGTDNRIEFLAIPKVHNLCKRLIPWSQLFEFHQLVIKSAGNIIRQIDEEYK